MATNLDKYEKDLDVLVASGDQMHVTLEIECRRDEYKAALRKEHSAAKMKKMLAEMPRFDQLYQLWYSETKAVVRLLLPDRLEDFVRYYEKPKPRKDITYESYRIEDALQGLLVTRGSAARRRRDDSGRS